MMMILIWILGTIRVRGVVGVLFLYLFTLWCQLVFGYLSVCVVCCSDKEKTWRLDMFMDVFM